MISLRPQQQKQLTANDSDTSSYLSQCSDDDNDDYEIVLTLKQKFAKQQQDFIMKKSINQDFSTSEFQFQTEANSHSLQTKKLDHSNNSNNKSANSDPSNDNVRQKNNNHLLQDTLDLNEILRILDQCQKDEKKSKKSNESDQKIVNAIENQQKYEKSSLKTNNYQHFSKQPYINHNKYQNFYDNPRRINNYQKQIISSKNNRYTKLPNRFDHCHQQFYVRQKRPIHPPYQPLIKKPQINPRRAEQFASTNYLFWGVLISVKLASFMSVSKNVLVVPFSNTQFSDPVSKIIQSKLKYNLKEIAIKQSKKCNQKQVPNGKIFSVKAKGLESNYRGIYFMKSPQNRKQSLKYYDASLLKKGIEKIFNLLDCHNEEHIVFPQFIWGYFSQGELCEHLISGIFREINENKKSYRCQYLKEVIICVSNCETFEIYSKYLRFYVKQMLG